LRLVGEVLSHDGAVRFRREDAAPVGDAEAAARFGADVSRALREAAGDKMPSFSG
jgi:hypothetical protein